MGGMSLLNTAIVIFFGSWLAVSGSMSKAPRWPWLLSSSITRSSITSP